MGDTARTAAATAPNTTATATIASALTSTPAVPAVVKKQSETEIAGQIKKNEEIEDSRLRKSKGRCLYFLIRAGNLDELNKFIKENEVDRDVVCVFPDMMKRDTNPTTGSVTFTIMDRKADFNAGSVSPLFPAILQIWRAESK